MSESKNDNQPNKAVVKLYYPNGKEEYIEATVGSIDRQTIYEGDSPTEYIVPFLIKSVEKTNVENEEIISHKK